MMVQGRHPEDPFPRPGLPFCILEITYLEDHGKAFHEEYAAEDRDQDLFPDHDCKYRYYATYGQAARIPHENLSGVGIIP